MKIMQLLPQLNSGGVERGTLEIAKALVDAGHQSLVVSHGGRMVAQLEAEGSTHLTLPIHQKSLASLWQIRPLRRLIMQHQPDIVHVRSRVPAWITHFALRGLPPAQRPHVVSTVHGFYSVNRYSQIMTRAERVIAVSDSVVNYIIQHYPQCRPDRITRIYRGINPQQFPHGYQPSVAWWQQTYSTYPELEHKRWITLAGRITRLKGHDTLIRLMPMLRQQDPEVHAVIVGGADPKKQPYLDELVALVAELDLQDAVTFVGHQSDIREWLAGSDVVLSLSTQAETFGRTALEALSLGIPVIGWNRGGVAEILSALYPQGLVEPEQITPLAQRLTRFLAAPDRPAVVHAFGLKQMTDATLALYQDCINQGRLL